MIIPPLASISQKVSAQQSQFISVKNFVEDFHEILIRWGSVRIEK